MRHVLLMGVLLALAGGFASKPVQAADAKEAKHAEKEHGAKDHADKGHGHDAKPDDAMGRFLQQVAEQGIWTIIVFVILLVVLRKVAWKPILEGLHKREESIHHALEEAKRAQEETAKLRQELQGEKDRAHEQVRALIEEARRDAQHTKDELLSQARQEIQTERDRLRREIDTARDQALHAIWNQAAQLATLISAKAIQRQLSEEDHRRLVDETIAELGQAGNGQRQAGSA